MISPTPKGSASPKVNEPAGGDDEFEKEFGDAPKTPDNTSGPKKKKEVYVPPPVGGGASVPETLGQGDVMQVVVNNKSAIVKCVSEQKAKDPDLTGTMIVRWTIQTSGKTSGVAVQTDEFKSTYLASCITGLVKQWQFPKHQQQGDPINFPFKF